MNLSLKKPLAFFDLETTGINIVKDRIIEIAVVKIHPNGKSEEFHSYVNPEMPVPAASQAIHGISDEDLKDKPKFKEVAKNVLKFFEGADLSGFNILKFDVPMLTEEFLRVDMDFDLKNRKIIDSQKLFFLMEPRNLAAAYQFYCEKNLEDAHSAMADTRACAEILDKQVERYEGRAVGSPGTELEFAL